MTNIGCVDESAWRFRRHLTRKIYMANEGRINDVKESQSNFNESGWAVNLQALQGKNKINKNLLRPLYIHGN